ncbi:LXG domain-containing protein [Alkalihalophilus lindianensis]|uniref:LXG domain-containing protein n=1 Tax=Alkalihalophilus lindianensis TaxID=1630542 RepID=A0ABU3XCY3_9BACI|nr:LXG domain-containing protein [Alkalihalophilus lindianensis]MDV2685748.1 LXG domain-containing protein [Alkalihalophilus lindianensis]
MKVLDVSALDLAIEETKRTLMKQSEQIQQIEQAIKSFTSLQDSFKGSGADAIRSFYEECHQPFLLLFQAVIDEYSTILDQIKGAMYSFEPAPNGFIHQQFLDDELNQGLEQTRSTTMYLTDQANSIMQRVSDIVQLPRLSDDDVLMHVDQTKRHVTETSENIMHFDYEQTNSLQAVEQSLRMMSQYLMTISNMFAHQGFTISSFISGQLKDDASYKMVNEALLSKTGQSIEQSLQQTDESPSWVGKVLDYFNTANRTIGFSDLAVVGSQAAMTTSTIFLTRKLEVGYLPKKTPPLMQRLKGDYRFSVGAHESWTSKSKHSSKTAKFLLDFSRSQPTNSMAQGLQRFAASYNSPSHMLSHLAGFPKNHTGSIVGSTLQTSFQSRMTTGTKEVVKQVFDAKGLQSVGRRIPIVGGAVSIAANVADAVDPNNADKSRSEKTGRVLAGIAADTGAIAVGAKAGAVIGSVGGPVGVIVGGTVGGLVGGVASSFAGDKVKDFGGSIGKSIGSGMNSIGNSFKSSTVGSWFK